MSARTENKRFGNTFCSGSLTKRESAKFVPQFSKCQSHVLTPQWNLKLKHKAVVKSCNEADALERPKRVDYIFKKRRESVSEVIAELVAKDGFSFNQIARGERTGRAFKSDSIDIPKNHQNVPDALWNNAVDFGEHCQWDPNSKGKGCSFLYQFWWINVSVKPSLFELEFTWVKKLPISWRQGCCWYYNRSCKCDDEIWKIFKSFMWHVWLMRFTCTFVTFFIK